MRVQVPRVVRNIAITVVVLIVLFVVAGVAYVMIVDRQTTAPPAKKTAAKPADTGTIKPVPPSPNAPEGVAMETLLSPVAAGDNTSAYIRTNAGSACSIVVTYNNVPAHDSGLVNKTADAYGFADWTWTVPATVPAGTWPVKVTCSYHGRSGVVIGNLQVTK